MENKTLIKANPAKKSDLKLKGVTKEETAMLKKNKMPLAVLLSLIGGAGAQYAFTNENGDIESDAEEAINEKNIKENHSGKTVDFDLPTNIQFSDAVTDDMSFSEAFRVARADIGTGFFNWNGHSYHTLTKSEWDSLSDEEKQELMNQIHENSDIDEIKIQDEPIQDEPIAVDPNQPEEPKTPEEQPTKDTDTNPAEPEPVDPTKPDAVKPSPDTTPEEPAVEPTKPDTVKPAPKDADTTRPEPDTIELEQLKPNQEEPIIERPDPISPSTKISEDNWEEEIPEEISYDDFIYEEDIEIAKEEIEEGFVSVNEIGTTEEILDGLNDGEATSEADGIAGGSEFDLEEYESNNPPELDEDIEFDEGFGEDLVD